MIRKCNHCGKVVEITDEMLGNSRIDCPECGHYICAECEAQAVLYAEKIGVYEYSVNGHLMEYISFFGQNEGWYYIVYDLESETEIYREKAFPWLGFIPYWLKTKTGATLYNYMEG